MACPVVVIEDTLEVLVTYLPEGTPFRFPRSADGRPHPWAGKQRWKEHDTQDLELDLWLPVDGPWRFKNQELLVERMRDGRYTTEQIVAIRRLGDELGELLDHGERWWDERWASFVPDPSWRAPEFPLGWETAPIPPAPGPEKLVFIQHKRSS